MNFRSKSPEVDLLAWTAIVEVNLLENRPNILDYGPGFAIPPIGWRKYSREWKKGQKP
jgi:hypothetical protein